MGAGDGDRGGGGFGGFGGGVRADADLPPALSPSRWQC